MGNEVQRAFRKLAIFPEFSLYQGPMSVERNDSPTTESSGQRRADILSNHIMNKMFLLSGSSCYTPSKPCFWRRQQPCFPSSIHHIKTMLKTNLIRGKAPSSLSALGLYKKWTSLPDMEGKPGTAHHAEPCLWPQALVHLWYTDVERSCDTGYFQAESQASLCLSALVGSGIENSEKV